MRLYTLTGATALDDPEYGRFEANHDGGFDLPEDLALRLRRFHVRGRPLWETDVERQDRLIREELDRRRDPSTLLDAVQQIVAAARAVGPLVPPAPTTPVQTVVEKTEEPPVVQPDPAAQEPPVDAPTGDPVKPVKATRGRAGNKQS